MLRRRIAAYGVCHDAQGRLLLVRAAAGSARPGVWGLPGGGLDQGEHPMDAVVRELAEETGLSAEVVRVRDVAAEVVVKPTGPEHTDGIIYDLAITGGGLRPEVDGSSDRAEWLPPAEAARLPLTRFAAHTLGLGAPTGVEPMLEPVPAVSSGPSPRPRRGQRFGVYGLVTDPAGRLLLTRNSIGYPSAGRWHAPGGGTDFGEQPRAGLLREITEESGQVGRVSELMTIVHRHNQTSRGPAGYPVDWHSVAAVFRVAVAEPTSPWVMDQGGSTEQAAWFTLAQAAELPLTDLAASLFTGREISGREIGRDVTGGAGNVR